MESHEDVIPSAPPAPLEGPSHHLHRLTPSPVVVDHPLNRPPERHRSRVLSHLVRHTDGDVHRIAKCFRELGDEVSVDDVRKELALYDSRAMESDDIDKEAGRLGAPSIYFCPISFHLMRDPVLLSTGQTYERKFIERWLDDGGSICPINGTELTKPATVTQNVALRQAIEEWAGVHAQWMLGANGHLLPVKEVQSVPADDDDVDADADLAIRLQADELEHRQRMPERTRRRQQQEPNDSQHLRTRRCISLLLLIVFVHFIVFVYTLYKQDWDFVKIDANPLIGFSAHVVRQVGGTSTSKISEDNEWWRIATSSLMTGGIVHLQWVVCCLWICGRFLATRMSFLPLGLIYVTSSVVGVLLSANLSMDVETVGSSAGAFGLIGAVVIEILVHRKHYQHHVLSLLLLFLLGAVGALVGTTPFVDNWSSLGGLIAGLCLTLALRLTHKGLQRSTPCLECFLVAIQVFWFLLVGFFVLAGCIGLFVEKEGRENCRWCQKLTCIDVHWWDCKAAMAPPDAYSCFYDIKGDLTTVITCPSGVTKTVQLKDVSDKALEKRCHDVCGLKKKKKSDGRSPGKSIDRLPETSNEDVASLGRNNIEQSKTE